jgi:glycosyltransferase involved in cell wall biosynthesis
VDSLAIVSMFKDEAATIKEWIIHHKLEGVQEFILLNNGSTDNSPEIAKQLGCQVIDCPEKHAQEK